MKNKIFAVILIAASVALMASGLFMHFSKKEIKEDNKVKVTEPKPDERSIEKDIYKNISGKAFQARDNGYKSVLIFSDYNENKKHQSMTILTISKKKTESDMCKYMIGDKGKSFIFNPDLKYPNKVSFKKKKSIIVIDNLRYYETNINKYSN